MLAPHGCVSIQVNRKLFHWKIDDRPQPIDLSAAILESEEPGKEK